jgi:hypothetical protein
MSVAMNARTTQVVWTSKRPPKGAVASLCLLLLIATKPVMAADTCERAEFEAAVTTASATLRDLSAEKKPKYQDKLRGLMEKRGWSYDQFVKEAGPLVADDKVAAFDQASADLLAKINGMGEVGRTVAAPNCALLAELRTTMAALVATQSEKWTYLFAKLDAESAR